MKKNYLVVCKTFNGIRNTVVMLGEEDSSPLKAAIESLENEGHGKITILGIYEISDEDAEYLSTKPEYNGDQSIASLYLKAESYKKTIQAANAAIEAMRRYKEEFACSSESLPDEITTLITEAEEINEKADSEKSDDSTVVN